MDQLQLRHPFTLPPSLSPNPPSCVTAGPSFLPSFLLTQRPGGVAGESGWPDVPPIRHTDRQTDKEQTCRQENAAATVDFGLGFLPIRSYKENDIIPVLIGQQEGGGRRGAAGCVGESVKEYEETKGNVSADQSRGRAMTMPVEVDLASCLQEALMCPVEIFISRNIHDFFFHSSSSS